VKKRTQGHEADRIFSSRERMVRSCDRITRPPSLEPEALGRVVQYGYGPPALVTPIEG
jgi:hypothetical protein